MCISEMELRLWEDGMGMAAWGLAIRPGPNLVVVGSAWVEWVEWVDGFSTSAWPHCLRCPVSEGNQMRSGGGSLTNRPNDYCRNSQRLTSNKSQLVEQSGQGPGDGGLRY